MNQLAKHLGESYLYHIWDGSHLRLNELRSSDGMILEVIHRGKWNIDSGPDFIDALIRYDGELRQGDVEIHVKEPEWYAHKHHLDKAYNRVILHAVLWGSRSPISTVSQAGNRIPTLILSDYLDESLAREQFNMGSGARRVTEDWPEICLLKAKSVSFIQRRAREWGLERLRDKMMRFDELRAGFSFDELLYHGVCSALGYSKNQRPFLKLAQTLKLDQIWAVLSGEDDLIRLQGIFFGVAGFLDHQHCGGHLASDVAAYLAELKAHWHEFRIKHQVQAMQAAEWKFFRLRPANFATVRLAGLCQLVLQRHNSGFFAPILHIFRTLHDNCGLIFHELERHFRVPSYGFWRSHVQFKQTLTRQPGESALIGSDKAREIVVNAVLPLTLAYAREAGDHALAAAVKETYQLAPSIQSNGTIRKMLAQLDCENGAHSAKACEQQGLIQMAKKLCPNWRCHDCLHGPGRK